MRRIALQVEYIGTAYHGWQKQEGVPSVQETVEAGLSKILCHPVDLVCAGRTDAGVHATSQVVHLETPTARALKALVSGTNVFLPEDIRILDAREVSDDFHARYSAVARQYQYWILNRPVSSPVFAGRALWMKYLLDIKPMHEAAQYLLGEQDFSALRGSECQSKSPFRCVHQARVFQASSDWICFEIEANAFLHHMVRNIVGLLLEIGQYFEKPEWVKTVIAGRDRRAAGINAPPEGLYLTGVRYPEKFQLWQPKTVFF